MDTPVRLLLLTAIAPVLAQVNPTTPPASQEPVLRITVNLVQVDAVVTDSRGGQVTNLTTDDFEILDDGRPQKITALSYVKIAGSPPERSKTSTRSTRPAAPPPPGRHLTPHQVRRTIVLMADDLGLSFESTARVRRSLKKFVDEQMQEGDLVAIIRTRGGMGALEQFTADKHILYAAIDRVRWYPGGLGGAGAFAPLGYDALSNAAKLQMAGPGGVQQTGGGRTRQIEEGRTENFSIGTLAAINFVVRALRELPGRKAVVLFSDGVPVFLRGRLQPQILNDLQGLTDLANRSAVIIYAVDARGLETFSLTAADNLDDPEHHNNPRAMAAEISNRREQFLDSQQGLDILALRTGGFVIHDSNDLNWGLGRVLDDLSGYYLIGYKPDESSFDRETGRRSFHNIQVKVKVHGLHVRSRTGYFGISDEQAKPVYRTRVEQLAAALTSPFSSGDLKVRLTCLFAGAAKQGAMVRALFHIDAHGLTFSDEPGGVHKSVVELVALAFDEKGASHDSSDRTFTLGLSQIQYQQALRSGILFTLNFPLEKAGAYQMRAAVRDAVSGKVGSAGQFVEIPDVRRHRLAISGINLTGVHPKIPGADADHAEGASDVAHADTAAVRVFRTGEAINYACVIFDAQVDGKNRQPALDTQLVLYRDSQQVYAGPVTPLDPAGQPDRTRLVLTGDLQLESPLPPGEYVLQVMAHDKLAPEKYRSASQWIDLEVVK